MWNLAFIVAFMTVTSIFQIPITSLLFHALVATILALCVQVAHRKGRSVLWDLELYCHRNSYRKRRYIVRCLADAFTSDQDKEKQREIMALIHDYTKTFDALLQRDLYLRDKQYIPSDSSNHDEALEETNKEIDRIWIQMGVNAQNLADSYRLYRDEPAWVRDYPMISLSHPFKNSGELECMMRFGCCFAECGCCEKPRRDMKGERGAAAGRGVVHCTVECGCCIQRRGFRLPEEVMGEESKQTENWELD
ncbi:hypothetical protein AWENTII_000714 [Aspergillus wentii]|nr:hypothetical protein MW887_001851 [Aspergillus wentii]